MSMRRLTERRGGLSQSPAKGVYSSISRRGEVLALARSCKVMERFAGISAWNVASSSQSGGAVNHTYLSSMRREQHDKDYAGTEFAPLS